MSTRRNRSNPSSKLPTLGDLELEVMLVVWELGECTSGDVIEAFRKRRELAASTLRNVLANLRAKGYVKPVPTIGRGFLLRPTVKRESVANHTLRGLLRSFFGNSPQQAIASLLDAGDATDEELESIRRMIEARRRKGEKS